MISSDVGEQLNAVATSFLPNTLALETPGGLTVPSEHSNITSQPRPCVGSGVGRQEYCPNVDYDKPIPKTSPGNGIDRLSDHRKVRMLYSMTKLT